MKNFWLVFSLLVAFAASASETWTNRVEVADRHALASMNCRWSDDGLKLQLVATNHAVIEVRLAPGRKPAIRLQPSKLFPADFEDAIQSWPAPAPATNVVSVAFRRQSHAWQLYLADQPVARFPEPWPEGAVLVRHPVSALPDAAQRDQYVQRTAPFKFEDTFTVPKTDEADKLPDTWERCSGAWHLHTVTGALTGTVRNNTLARQPTPEHSPNFYSVEGRGRHAIALAGEPFQHRYTFRASVQHNGGTNGLVFLATEGGACHGFTVCTDPETERLVFELWRGGLATNAPRQVLAAAATDLQAGQWTLMEVRVFDDRVVCLADNIELLRQRLPLPPGGRFGLFADTEAGTRFDDVAVSSHEEYPFESAAELAFHTLQRAGAIRNTTGATLAPPGGDPAAVALESAGDRQPREWLFGATDDGPHKLEVCIQPPAGEDFACSLLAGWQGAQAPGYRFTCRQAGGRRLAVLERVGAAGAVPLDAADLGPATAEPVRLTLDGLRVNELRGLVNGRLAVLDRPAAPLTGAGGLRLEGRARVRLSLPQYVSAAPVYADRFEKNPAFVNDPFMRHWASPEGQWITMRDGLTWLRGDIMGRAKIRLPAVEPSTLHLVIPEGATNGACVIEVRNGRLGVRLPATTGTNTAFTVALTNIPEEKVESGAALRLYTVNLEDDLLWISCDGAILGRCHLPPLPKGRRARVEGFSLDQLHQTLVRRENVFDTLFNESLFNWTIDGGRWEVVNRFQCEPSWSHMNGENGESFAGLWSNYELVGDFCVEFYAGMRMGWYERPGDFNLTVHSRRDATCDGYTVTTAGWDPDHSQLYTRLFRNGEQVAASTAYTAPRVREGSVRGGYEPLIAGGRPVHGAWYGMRFRRVGDQISYIFDNEPILAWRDPSPLAAGALGVWTYRNSIMVARVRVAAEAVRPRPYRFWPVDSAAPRRVPPAPVAATVPGLRVNGQPPELLDPAVWQDADLVSRPLVRFPVDGDGRPSLRATAMAGGGTFLVAPHLRPQPASRLLGWRFDVARHPEARFNFEFSVGRTNADAAFVPATRYSYVICGSDDPRGERRLTGRLAAPPAASRPDAAGRDCVWTPVEVWLPGDAVRKDQLVVIDGFGNLQPGEIQEGLKGNPPGAWYAVRNFRAIGNGLPELAGPPAVRAELDAWTKTASKLPAGQVHELRLPASLDAREPVLAWAVRPEAEFGLAARLDDVVPEAIRVRCTFPWASPLLPARAARLDDQPAPGWQEGNDYVVLLPRSAEEPARQAATLALDLADGRTFKQVVPLASSATQALPVLLTCEMPEGGLETFEARPLDPQRHVGRAGFAMSCTDPLQGTSIRFQNCGVADARLDGRVLPAYDPAIAPLLQFRYKADPMAHVSLTASRCNIAFSETWGTLAAEGATGVLDNAWHTWFGYPLSAVPGGPLRQGYAVQPSELRVASHGTPDQTGHYSAISFDDVACGPAVGPRHPLAFRPGYSSRDGVAQVVYALVEGAAPWTARSDQARADARWIAVTNLQVVAPDTAALPEGVHHLVTRARSRRGAWSAVYDVPFVLDRQPPQVTYQIRSVPDRYNGTCLDLDIAGGYAPPVVRNLRLTCDGKPLDLATDNGAVSYGPAAVHLEIDWPWLLRTFRRNCKDGDTLHLRLDGIADAAGNEAPALDIPIKLNFADDKQPPAVMPLAPTTNVLVSTPFFRTVQDFFNDVSQVSGQPPQQENGCNFIPFRCLGGEPAFLARQFTGKPWNPEAFPWLAISVRLEGDFPAGAAPFTLQIRPGANLADQAVKPKDGNAFFWSFPATDGQPFVVGHVDWRPGHWNDLLINVRDLLRERTQMPQACNVREAGFHFPEKTGFTLQVRGMAILAPWGPNDVLKFQAYDLNGVAGLRWQNGGRSTKTGLRPARLALPPDDAQWLKVRVSDNPGNLTPVYMIPMPPRPAPVPDSLPLEVDVENF